MKQIPAMKQIPVIECDEAVQEACGVVFTMYVKSLMKTDIRMTQDLFVVIQVSSLVIFHVPFFFNFTPTFSRILTQDTVLDILSKKKKKKRVR